MTTFLGVIAMMIFLVEDPRISGLGSTVFISLVSMLGAKLAYEEQQAFQQHVRRLIKMTPRHAYTNVSAKKPRSPDDAYQLEGDIYKPVLLVVTKRYLWICENNPGWQFGQPTQMAVLIARPDITQLALKNSFIEMEFLTRVGSMKTRLMASEAQALIETLERPVES